MDYSASGFPALPYLPKFAQTLVPCHSAISCSVAPFSSCPLFPSIRIFSNESSVLIRWPKYWSFSISVLPVNYSGLLSLGLIGWISLQSKGLSRVFSNSTVQKRQFFSAQTLTSVHEYWKNHSFDWMDLCQQSDSSAF